VFSPPYNWTYLNFPNPWFNFTRCNRNARSYVCDPNQILRVAVANSIDQTFTRIRGFGDPRCAAGGYELAMAVVGRMDIPYGQNSTTYSASFARNLITLWGVGKRDCNNGAVVFLSKFDRKVFIATGNGISSILTSAKISNVIASVTSYLKADDYDNALFTMAKSIEDILRPSTPLAPSSPPTQTSYIFGIVAVVVFVLIVCAVLAWCRRAGYHHYLQYDPQRASVRRYLEAMEAEARCNSYNTCPCCFQSYGFSASTLQCGHRFCGNCVSSRSIYSFCPICTEMSTYDMQRRELQYRLHALNGMYPGYITPGFMVYAHDHCHDGGWFGHSDWSHHGGHHHGGSTYTNTNTAGGFGGGDAGWGGNDGGYAGGSDGGGGYAGGGDGGGDGGGGGDGAGGSW